MKKGYIPAVTADGKAANENKGILNKRTGLREQARNVKTRGFTLIELLAVVLIMGVLAAAALSQYQNAVERAKAAEAKTLLKSLYHSYILCVMENGNKDNCLYQSEENNLLVNGTVGMPGEIRTDMNCPVDKQLCFHTRDWQYSIAENGMIWANRVLRGKEGNVDSWIYYLTLYRGDGHIECHMKDSQAHTDWCKKIGSCRDCTLN